MGMEIVFMIFGILLMVAFVIGIFLAVRYLVKYHAQLTKKKTPQQAEMERMKLDDLS